MSRIAVIYGSTTGTCETIAGTIAGKLGTSDIFSAADLDDAKIAAYDVLVLGSSTWGDGELQDDWFDAVEVLKNADNDMYIHKAEMKKNDPNQIRGA